MALEEEKQMKIFYFSLKVEKLCILFSSSMYLVFIFIEFRLLEMEGNIKTLLLSQREN